MRFLKMNSTIMGMTAAGAFLTSMSHACEIPSAVPVGPTSSQVAIVSTLDPILLLEELIERYQRLVLYRDTTDVVRTVRDAQGGEQTVSTQLDCRVADDELSIVTPASQMRSSFGLNLPFRESESMKRYRKRYQYWLAPHMAIGFSKHPLDDLQGGSTHILQATEARSVTVEDRHMVRLKIESKPRPGKKNGNFISLFINPDSMLVERVEEKRHLPGGKVQTTMFNITPTMVVDIEPTDTDPVRKDPIITPGTPSEPSVPASPLVPDSPTIPLTVPVSPEPPTQDSPDELDPVGEPASDPRPEPVPSPVTPRKP